MLLAMLTELVQEFLYMGSGERKVVVILQKDCCQGQRDCALLTHVSEGNNLEWWALLDSNQ
jgi:hypothetical protein